jgi:transposase-like protein
MKQKRHSVDQIVSKLRKADVELGKGKKVPEVCKELEVTEQTYYRWRQKYGGMSPELIRELRTLQKENQRLRKIIADQRIDLEIQKEAIEISSKNF